MFSFKNWRAENEKLGIEGSSMIPSTEITLAIN